MWAAANVSLRDEDQGVADEALLAVRRRVLDLAVHDEIGRAAAVEVQRILRAELHEQPRPVRQRQADAVRLAAVDDS